MGALKAEIKSNLATKTLNKDSLTDANNTTQNSQLPIKEALVDEKQLFMDAIGQVKPITNDTVRLTKSGHKSNTSLKNDQADNKANRAIAQFHFSDEFEPDLNKQGPMKYVREGVDSFEVKNLRRGHYRPDLILDLHGLDQHQAKKELAALLFACQKEHAQCICVVHGIGSHILKNKVPHWLVQHPDVMAFHQAPLEWGGNGAILALIELKDKFN
ncbi:endonuclease SmrB [Colwellia sp. E2M01]|nr:endonuclease SmrB [Colwellia sp. E2M01]